MTLVGELRVVDHVAPAFAELVRHEAPRSLALSGGDTARSCYEVLATTEMPWEEVSVYFSDERWVDIQHPDSNEGMARLALLDQVEPRVVHSMARAGTTIEAAADNYDALLRFEPPIDLVHLGLGTDGHTASLFPGSPALDEAERLVVPTTDARHPHARLTLTLPGIVRARLVVVTVAGAAKREALDAVRHGADVPAARIRAQRVIWLADRLAAPEA